ncbi:MAG TPA: polynucleotide kinase-phosphatase [Aggregatilineales bacterium]|nr:polynucleotide kinase-phosphatase [Aggregatilineales bacterium]
MTSTISIPELSLVVLIGASGSGKSTFARKHFKPTEVISSDFCRGLVSDDENSQEATEAAFEVLNTIAAKRLQAGKLTVIDATNVQPEDRKGLVALARKYHTLPVALVLNLPERLCQERNSTRPERAFGPHVIRRQRQALRRSLRGLQREGFRHVFTFSTPEAVDAVTITREPLWNNRKTEHGPFDIIGDVHGCYDELAQLLARLGYQIHEDGQVTAPEGRKAVFLGDLVDRGPKVPAVLRLVMSMVEAGSALCVPGNHDVKLLRKLKGKNVQITHGLAESLLQLEAEPAQFKDNVAQFLDDLVSHYVLDDGKLVVAHAGMLEAMQGRGSGKVREFALYGETTGETDEFGLPVRYNWAAQYRGQALVVYGHTPVPEPDWLNNTINIDTGCVFGGSLTALRYPERELVSVPAAHIYAEPIRPFLEAGRTGTELPLKAGYDDVLELEDVVGKRIIETQLNGKITIREENAAAALEVMSRFAIDPRWLIYLPPTMSPTETTQEPGLLEHPGEAFAYYRTQGVPRVICEEKHMGSRAVIILCRDESVARRRFGIEGSGIGVCYTRTGRRFFNDPSMESGLLQTIHSGMTHAALWEELQTDWICLDAELMPWSAKAQDLLRGQYAAVGTAARHALGETTATLGTASANGADVGALIERTRSRAALAEDFVAAYRRYCWPVASLDDLKLAPFHILATEGHTYAGRDHLWHMQMIALLCQASGSVLLQTAHKVIEVTDPAQVSQAIAWWEELTDHGGEGMVVKPLDFIARGQYGLLQPAVKCRGREYLRIIYGMEYTIPENLESLRSRGLAAKRSLALREFALGVEGLERFVRHEPLRRVHECVFGVMALESEGVDPRL